MLITLRCVLMLPTLTMGCHAARILAVFATPSRSHVIAYEALTKELASRGHQVTVVSMFPQEKPLDNYTDIAVPYSKFGMEKMDMFKMREKSQLLMMKTFSSLGGEICHLFLGNPRVQQLIHGRDDLFDILIVSYFMNDCVLGFTHKFNVPMIGISPMGGMHFMFEFMGSPVPYSITPDVFMDYTDRMDFGQRLLNTISLAVHGVVRMFLMESDQDALMRQYFNTSESLPHVKELARRTTLLLLNNHVSLTYPRALMPNVIEVGGMHLKPGANLPEDLQTFLNAATNGVIYFSMGSNLRSADLPEEKRRAFLEAFSRMKQQVLWKWEEEELPGQPGNVRLAKWLPQAAILAHPNVRVFVTHGGLLSLQEAVFNGVPMVTIPVFADQPLNAKRAENMGIAVKLDYENVTSDSLQWALETVTGNPSYGDRVKELSSRFRDQPTTPLERAVFWTEYVIRHNGAPHWRSPALDLAWYQYFLLDVVAVMLLVAGLVAALVYVIIKTVASFVCSRNIKNNSKSKTS